MNHARIMSAAAIAIAAIFSAPWANASEQPAASEKDSAGAEATADDEDNERGTVVGRGYPSDQLPPAQSDDDVPPPVPAPRIPAEGVITQAGTGGPTAYGRAGVLELGGAASFASATDFTQVTLNPSLGWFFLDNVEASAILGISHLSAEGVNSTILSFLVEPSLHLPFSDNVFGFLGAGIGPAWADGPGLGLAVAPRIGFNALVGRSGVLTPAAFLQYSTHEAVTTPNGTFLAVALTVGASIGYSVMW